MLIPPSTSIIFWLIVSTFLVLFMVPPPHAIIEDFRSTAEG